MTQAHKLKKAIRARAKKTGESYTAARRHVVATRSRAVAKSPTTTKTVEPAKPKPSRKTSLGSVTDKVARQKTGHGLDHWFAVLDAFGVDRKGHAAAAVHLSEKHAVPDWYCQGITVAYERSRGLRGVNQSCDGKYQVSVSRVVPASVAEVVAALRSKKRRAGWLADADRDLVTALGAGLDTEKGRALAVREKGDARLRYKWGRGAVEIRITPKGDDRASIVADNKDIGSEDGIEPRRAAWTVALDALRQHLSR